MAYTFRDASQTEAKPLIGLYSESGCGKTKSALLIAKGFSGDMKQVGMIETESGRGEAYAADPEVGGYRVLSLRGNFSPVEYGKAIKAAEGAGLRVLIIDSASHEWESEGGVLAMAAENQAAGKKGPLVWQQPKIQHQREFMLRLLATPIPLVIVCMRAKYPMKEIVKDGRKEWVRWHLVEPKQSEDILYEMFIHGWIDQQHVFHGTKYTLGELKDVLKDGEPLSVESGKRLASWAAGRQTGSAAPPRFAPGPETRDDPHEPAGAAPRITAAQADEIAIILSQSGALEQRFWLSMKKHGWSSLDQIPAGKFDEIIKWLDDRRK